jgi:hypothetical protein
MLGVTLFGIFLTPVFFYVIQWYSDWRAERRGPVEEDEEEELAESHPARPAPHEGAPASIMTEPRH